jgi:hypothetical protein
MATSIIDINAKKFLEQDPELKRTFDELMHKKAKLAIIAKQLSHITLEKAATQEGLKQIHVQAYAALPDNIRTGVPTPGATEQQTLTK